MALTRRLGAPHDLRSLGLEEHDIAADARTVAEAAPPSNPRPVTAADAERILRAAWAGQDPTSDPMPDPPPDPTPHKEERR